MWHLHQNKTLYGWLSATSLDTAFMHGRSCFKKSQLCFCSKYIHPRNNLWTQTVLCTDHLFARYSEMRWFYFGLHKRSTRPNEMGGVICWNPEKKIRSSWRICYPRLIVGNHPGCWGAPNYMKIFGTALFLFSAVSPVAVGRTGSCVSTVCVCLSVLTPPCVGVCCVCSGDPPAVQW